MYILYEHYLVGEFSPSLQKIRLIFILILVHIKGSKISKRILKSFKSFNVESYLASYVAFTHIKEFAFLENLTHFFFHANFDQVFYDFLSPSFKI